MGGKNGDTGFEFGIVCVCIVYYSAKFGLHEIRKQADTYFYTAFFALIFASVCLQLLYTIQVQRADPVLHLTMMYTVAGPLLDLLWVGTWPGSGAMVLWVSQLVFVLRVGMTSTYGIAGWAIWGCSALLFGLGMVYEKRVLSLFYPVVRELGAQNL